MLRYQQETQAGNNSVIINAVLWVTVTARKTGGSLQIYERAGVESDISRRKFVATN